MLSGIMRGLELTGWDSWGEAEGVGERGTGTLQAVLVAHEQHGCVVDSMPLSLSQNATCFSRVVGEAGI